MCRYLSIKHSVALVERSLHAINQINIRPFRGVASGCGPHRAALARGGKWTEIVFLVYVKIQIVI